MLEHKENTPRHLDIGIVTVSSTRSMVEDQSGKWIGKRAKKEGHTIVFRRVIPDDAEAIKETVLTLISEKKPHAILLTGGTGLSSKDVTIEAVHPLFKKELTAFGPVFAQLSFEEIDSSAIMSRATAGIIDSTVVFCIPGSIKACKLACKALIFPELGHIAKHVSES